MVTDHLPEVGFSVHERFVEQSERLDNSPLVIESQETTAQQKG